MKKRIALMLTAITLTAAAHAEDHPLVPRFNGSDLIKQENLRSDSYRLLVHPLENPSSSSPEHKDTWLAVNGRITRIAYQAPRGNSVGDVFHSYESKLQSEGFEILYNCAGQTCSPSTRGAAFSTAMAPPDLGDKMQGKPRSQRYFAAKLRRTEGDVYVALYATRTDPSHETRDDPVYSNVVIIESPVSRKD